MDAGTYEARCEYRESRRPGMMQQLYDANFKQEREVYDDQHQIAVKIAKHRKAIERLEKKQNSLWPKSWVETIVVPLAAKLAEHFNLKFEIYGPFGLRSTTSIYLLSDPKKGIVDSETYSITLTPHVVGDGMTVCYYETGEKDATYPPGSIGDLNGYGNVEAPLPDTIEEIIPLMRHSEGKENNP